MKRYQIQSWNQPNGAGGGWALCPPGAPGAVFFVFIDGRREARTFQTRGEAKGYIDRLKGLFARYSRCRVCDGPVPPQIARWARQQFEQKTCSTACAQAEIKKRFACCEQAEPKACVCMYSFTCPVHGETHIGSHD